MIRLSDLRFPAARDWDEARAAFTWPPIGDYNISADCLEHEGDRAAVLTLAGDRLEPLSFAGLAELTARLARCLAEVHGISSGDRVAVKLPQGADMAVAVLAVLKLGAVVVTVSDVLGDEAVLHRLTDSGARLLVCAGTERELGLAHRAGTAVLATDGGTPWLRGGLDRYEPLTDTAATGPDDAALLLYTSGTTGKSKGVLHGHRVLLGHHAIDLAWDRIRPGDVAYSPIDWAWAGGLMLGLLVPLAHGVTVLAHRSPRFDPQHAVRLFREAGVSIGMFPPTALRILRRSGALTAESMRDLRLRCLITGAEAVEPELAAWARDEIGLTVNNAFGQTEANALIGHAAALGPLDPRALGRPYPGHEIAVLDADRVPVAPGAAGELAVRSDDPVCMLRYWNAPEATAAKVRDGWLLTGDSAHAEPDGTLVFHGRADDIIKSGGYRLGPAEIEAALRTDPAVAECAVVGIPEPERGHVVTAFVLPAAGTSRSDDLVRRLQQQVRDRVGAHAYPRRVEFVADLPRTATGKIDRRALRLAAEKGVRT
ncbi:acyl-CoA synthetase/AMP-acid ligase [Mycobacterium tuberculosis]|nr:acyl-CoA synthetase/AMP-acid ligase [Mycobacterium tuberculosis]